MKILLAVTALAAELITTIAAGQNAVALGELLQPFVRVQLSAALCMRNNPKFLDPFEGEAAFLNNIRHVHLEVVAGLTIAQQEGVLAIGVNPVREELRQKLRSFELTANTYDEVGISVWCNANVISLVNDTFREHATNHDAFLKRLALAKRATP